jgi:long-subunit acyl-CoA synthetase (AMP-forming)
MLSHGNVLSSIEAINRIIPPLEHRIVSVLPLSHRLEQAAGLFYAIEVGADILYVRSRNPRVIFEAIRDHRTTSMILVPQVLDLFWTAIEREVDRSGRATSFRRLRAIPATRRCGPGGSCSAASTTVRRGLRASSYRPPPSSRLRSSRRGGPS